jgi:hypothetical protein
MKIGVRARFSFSAGDSNTSGPAFGSLWSPLFWPGESSGQKRGDALKGANTVAVMASAEIGL